MGLKGGQQDFKKYIQINRGAFTVRVPEGTEGSIGRKLMKGKNEGKMIYELRYSELEGLIVNIKYKVKEFGKFIEVTIRDDQEQKDYILQMPWKQFGARDSFIKRLPNVDLKMPVTFVTFPDKDTGNTVFLIKQNDVIVKMSHTKDNPNGMPEAKKVESLGVIEWDYSECENFLYNLLQSYIKKFEDKTNYNGHGINNDEEYTPNNKAELDKLLPDDEPPIEAYENEPPF